MEKLENKYIELVNRLIDNYIERRSIEMDIEKYFDSEEINIAKEEKIIVWNKSILHIARLYNCIITVKGKDYDALNDTYLYYLDCHVGGARFYTILDEDIESDNAVLKELIKDGYLTL